MADMLTPEKRSWNMSRIRGIDTKPELILRSQLHRAGFRFRIHDKRLPGKPDIVLTRFKTVIFVNGCFWHRHEGCKYAYDPKSRQDFWTNKFARTLLRDQKHNRLLIHEGWSVLTVWECELKINLQEVLDKIIKDLKRLS